MKQIIIDSQNKPPNAYLAAIRRMMDLGYFIQSFTLSGGVGVIIANSEKPMSQEHQKEITQIIDDPSHRRKSNVPL